MSFKNWIYLWFVILVVLIYEHLALNYFPAISLLNNIKAMGHFDKAMEFTTAPGRPLSYFYGVLGFAIMLCTNFYILRKRLSFLRGLGDLRKWLDVHIFFGIVGPTLIVFHSDFKVRGIVAISFWSMMISASSGVVGRYFYINVSKKQKEYSDLLEKAIQELKKILPKDKMGDDVHLKEIVERGFKYMGGRAGDGDVSFLGLPKFLIQTSMGDIKELLRVPVLFSYAGTEVDKKLKLIGKLKRNEVYAETYGRLLSYWHTFHLPFAFFMYATAVVHIISSLIFKV